jgi:DNA-binding LacI/PurR family transcriptional regulator
VSAAMRERVLAAIDELGYRVNVAARNLRSGRTGTIGLAVPEFDRPYFGQLAARISAHADSRGYRVVVEQTGATREQEIAALLESRKRMYDGLILSTVALGPPDADLLKVDYPIVILGERIFDGPADHVAMPNVDGAEAAVQHLIEVGCRRIAMLGGPYAEGGTDVGTLRQAGYRSALAAAGFPFDPALVVALDAFTTPAGAEGARRLITQAPDVDGVFCITDTVAFGAIRALHDAGRVVPRDVKVIGFDALEQGEFSIPSLTTIDPDHAFMARTAVDMLVKRMANDGFAEKPTEVISSFQLRLGESTAL